MPLLTISNLNYSVGNNIFFKDFNLDIEYGKFISIIAPNNSGKTMLTKLMCAIIPTYDMFKLDGISLNKENVLKYIKKIGIVSNSFKNPFLYKKVRDELSYPLINLGYNELKINRIVNNYLNVFEMNYVLNKRIIDLSNSEKNKLKIVVSLVHNPKLLVLDDVFNDMSDIDIKFVLDKLIKLNKNGLTILNITSKLDTIYYSDKVYIMNKFKIEDCLELNELLEQTTRLTRLGFRIPFIIDLSSKLKLYNLVDKIYFNDELLEEKLWK